MSRRQAGEPDELTYPLGAAMRLTGLSADLLRAWERRYGVVTPLRTAGGTRRYRASDIDRLRLVKAAVDAGFRVGEVSRLAPEELARRIADRQPAPADPLSETLDALRQLDAAAVEERLALQISVLGPVLFAKRFATPLLQAIGDAWEKGDLPVAAEHLASGALRSLLGAALRNPVSAAGRAPILFATLPGERHELGLLVAALVACGAGARVIYIGADTPVEELAAAASRTRAATVAISVVCQPEREALDQLTRLREGLDGRTRIWLGGSGASPNWSLPAGVVRVEGLDSLEHQVALSGHAAVRP